MKVVSVNVGMPRDVVWQGRTVSTGIFKAPVAGPVMMRRLNLDGDGQADLTVHGGADKAVYLYPAEHYAGWRTDLPDVPLDWGAFGENLTVTGLDEERVRVGDRLRVGEAELVVTQPRLPCYKLSVRFGRTDLPKRVLTTRRLGFYAAVQREGAVAAGDPITLVGSENGPSIADVTRLYLHDVDDEALLRRATRTAALPEDWRAIFRERLRPHG